jgi:hypothetical protein
MFGRMTLSRLLLFLASSLAMFAEDRPISSQFPRVRGIYQMTDTWSVTLPSEFAKRFEEGSLVLWRKDLTCWTAGYNLKEGETPKQRFDRLKSDAPKDAIERWESTDSIPLRFAYLLYEKEDAGERWALYTITVGNRSHVMMAIYFDKKEDLEEARAIGMSINERKETNQSTQPARGKAARG